MSALETRLLALVGGLGVATREPDGMGAGLATGPMNYGTGGPLSLGVPARLQPMGSEPEDPTLG